MLTVTVAGIGDQDIASLGDGITASLALSADYAALNNISITYSETNTSSSTQIVDDYTYSQDFFWYPAADGTTRKATYSASQAMVINGSEVSGHEDDWADSGYGQWSYTQSLNMTFSLGNGYVLSDAVSNAYSVTEGVRNDLDNDPNREAIRSAALFFSGPGSSVVLTGKSPATPQYFAVGWETGAATAGVDETLVLDQFAMRASADPVGGGVQFAHNGDVPQYF